MAVYLQTHLLKSVAVNWSLAGQLGVGFQIKSIVKLDTSVFIHMCVRMYISRPCVNVSDQGVIIPMSKVEYSCSGDVATPRVLNGHGNTKRRAELYCLFRPGQPPKLADLEEII